MVPSVIQMEFIARTTNTRELWHYVLRRVLGDAKAFLECDGVPNVLESTPACAAIVVAEALPAEVRRVCTWAFRDEDLPGIPGAHPILKEKKEFVDRGQS